MSDGIKAIGRYWLVNKLGEGGMGEVFRAYAIGPDGIKVPYAIKLMKRSEKGDEEQLKQFRSEAVLASRLKHNAIGSFIEFFAHGDQYALVMEYVEGLSLSQLFNDVRHSNQNLPVPFALYLAAQIADGLGYLHRYVDPQSGNATEVIHGDLSPQNVIINFEGEVKLIDFGLARLHKQVQTSSMKTEFANVWYTSPSRVNTRTISKSDDIFGFGIILWELVTGQRYHGLKDQLAVMKDLISFAPRNIRESMPEIPETLASIIDGCLNCESLNGYHSMEELQRDVHVELKRVEPGFIAGHFREFLKRSYDKKIADAREATHRYGELVDEHVRGNVKVSGTWTMPSAPAAKPTPIQPLIPQPNAPQAVSRAASPTPRPASAAASSVPQTPRKSDNSLILLFGSFTIILVVGIFVLQSGVFDRKMPKKMQVTEFGVTSDAPLQTAETYETDVSRSTASQPESQHRSFLNRLIPSSESTSAQKVTTTIYVSSYPIGANVYRDGELIGTTPFTIPATPGKGFPLLFEIPGQTSFSMIVDGRPQNIYVNLETQDYEVHEQPSN